MANYKLLKNSKIGTLAAESDTILSSVFVDVGIINKLTNPRDPVFLIRGRTGTGKTALLRKVSEESDLFSFLDPEGLSMQYLHSNMIIKSILDLNVHLDIFFKYLWKHIFILELIKLKYSKDKNVYIIGSKIRGMFLSGRRTQKAALEYLDKHGDEYWVQADTHVKAFTSELETKIKNDDMLGAQLGDKMFGLNGSTKTSEESTKKDKIEAEVITRTQKIVNDYQMNALDEIIDGLAKDAFNDEKKTYHIAIDDLDKNWMPDDAIYLEMIKALLQTVRDLNQKFTNVKILVALRSNIYFRIFKKTKISEPQREKWEDVIVDLIWNSQELEDIVLRRFAELYREHYTKNPPTLNGIFPHSKRRKQNGWDYLLDRSFYRPRDIIEFINICLNVSKWTLPFTWGQIEESESVYSKKRKESLIDEWKDSYFGISAIFPILKKLGKSFTADSISETDILDILTSKQCEECVWLSKLYEEFSNHAVPYEKIVQEIINALYITGLIGKKSSDDHKVNFAFEQSFFVQEFSVEEMDEYIFLVHKAFHKSLSITNSSKFSSSEEA